MNFHRLSSFSSSSSFQLSASCGIWTYSHDPHLENSLPALGYNSIFLQQKILYITYTGVTTYGNVDRQNLQGNGKGEARSSENLTALG